MTRLEEIKQKAPQLTSEQLIDLYSDYIGQNPRDDEALTARGLVYWGMGRRSDAINDYLAAIEINPDSKARLALKAANDILDYYNKDMYNP